MNYAWMLAGAILFALMIVWAISGSLAPELHLIGHGVVGVIVVLNIVEYLRKRRR